VSFQFPQMYVGCLVEVSNDPSRSDSFLGFVTAVKGNAVDLVHFGTESWGPRRDVWHEDDPRCIEHPDHFQDNISGVFRLSEGEVQRRQLVARLDALEARLAGVSAEMRQVLEQASSKPKRGRPPKQRDPEPALT
jgi:hypothetical protein